jgi:ABC-type amino acid transport substrate-binding protein
MRRKKERSDALRQRLFLPLGIVLIVLALAPAEKATGQQLTPFTSTPISLTESEEAWLAQHRDIRLGVNPAYPPFDFIDEKGVFSGMSADYVALISKRLGVTMHVVGGLSWGEVLDDTKDGRIDVVVGVKPTEARQGFLNFTKDYLTFPLVIMTRDTHPMIASLYGLRDATLALAEGYGSSEEIRSRYPDLKYRVVPSLLDAMRAVERGEVDATVINLGSASYLIAKHDIRGVVVAAPAGIEDARSAFGIRKDWPELASLFDKALASITPQEEDAIRDKWVTVPYDARQAANRSRMILFRVGGGAAIVIILVFLWNRRLKREVRRRRDAEAVVARQ